ncbi:MAG TPA: MFS transporter [Mycobacteriales bacterium]
MSSRVAQKNLVLAAMIFAVSMTFIDQTIVAIAVPQIQTELGLSISGVQWAVNAYLLALASFFAFGGRLSDTLGHRRMVVIGVVLFAAASALCGATPRGAGAEAWIVTFRALQGVGGAIMYPASLAIVVSTFPLRERGRALAMFFGIAGGLTAVGPILGGYLTEWTWRAIFWINIPVALIALALIWVSKPVTEHRRAPMDYRGAALIAAAAGLSVFGFQQSSIWGWTNAGTGLCIAAGLGLFVVFYRVELRTASPVIDVSIFRKRPFLVENLVLGVSMLVFVPIFVFASQYAQISLLQTSSNSGLFLLYLFIGFVIAAQIGGRMLDRGGARRPVVLGCAIGAVGFYLWSQHVTGLRLADQRWYVILAGFGLGLMLGPASTDAVNRAGRLSYGEATGITQTVRNYAASLGLAALGSLQIAVFRSHLASALTAQGVPAAAAHHQAGAIAQAGQGSGSGQVADIPHFVSLAFADATRAVLVGMAVIMAVSTVVAFLGLRPGVQPDDEAAPAQQSSPRRDVPGPRPEPIR